RIRLSVAVPRLEALAYLARVGWRGDDDRLGWTVDRCAVGCGLDHPHARLQVDFDLEGMPDTLGIGLTPASGREWSSVLRHVSALVPCDEEKLDALGAWPARVARRIGDRDVTIGRYLSHVKLAWKPEGVRAKAYFGVAGSANPGA